MVRLTILIPCLGPVENCEDTLVSVLQHRPADSEVVVVHTQPYADPYDLRKEVRFLVVSGKPDLCTLVNSGLEVSSGEVLHLLSPDLLVSEGWTDSALRWFEASAVGAVSPWLIATDSSITSAGVAYSPGGRRVVVGGSAKLVDTRLHSVVGPTLRGAFYRRDAIVSLGGLSSEVGDELADVDVALAMRQAGWKVAVEPCCRLTDQQQAHSAKLRGWKAGKSSERLFLRHAAENSWALSLLCHPFVAGWDVLSQFPNPSLLTDATGRFAAWLEAGTTESYRAQVAASTEKLARLRAEESQSRTRVPLTRKAVAGSVPVPGLPAQRRAA